MLLTLYILCKQLTKYYGHGEGQRITKRSYHFLKSAIVFVRPLSELVYSLELYFKILNPHNPNPSKPVDVLSFVVQKCLHRKRT
jgi:hypothetical protein